MPTVDVRVRLRTSSAVHHLVPTPLAIRRAEAKGRAQWSDPADREHAIATLDAIVGATERSHEAPQLAHRHLIEQEVHKALFWQPWRAVSVDASSSANLRAALSADRPLLVSACHLGPYFLQLSALASLGCSTIAVSAPWFFAEPSQDYWGRRLARWRTGIRNRGERLVCAEGSFALLEALLGLGEIVLNYFDMPGGTSTQFLGKPVMLTSGSARLAFQADALILPLRARRTGARVWTDVWEPLDPRQFDTPLELHAALAKVHERSILELPETLEDPNRPGTWEGGATASEWVRPQPRAEARAPADA